MLVKLFKWLRGYLCITIMGGSPERFINLCKNHDIHIWKLKNEDETYKFELLAKDYKLLKRIAKKSKTIPMIDKKIGLPFLVNKYRKKKCFFIGIFLFFLLIHLLSLNIWNISIKGGMSYTQEALLEYLIKQDIYIGKRIRDIDCREIEENIRETYTDISWVSAEIKGTNLLINLKETNIPEQGKQDTNPCHIIAGKNGIITEIVTRRGTPIVKKGDIVKEGDILVSGIVEVIGDNDLLVSKEAVVADGDIRAKAYYEYEDEFPLSNKDREYTGNKKTNYSLSLLSNEINLPKRGISYEIYDIISEEVVFQPIRNFYMPFSLILTSYLEYIEVDIRYTEEEAIEIAKSNINRIIRKLEENDVIILEKDINIEMNKDSCTAKGKIIVEESITEYRKVKEVEWRMEQEDGISGASD